MLNAIRFLFELKGTLSGYKTYVAAFAGVLAVTGQFISAGVMPFLDGDISAMTLLTVNGPGYIEALSPIFAVGTLRAGLAKSAR